MSIERRKKVNGVLWFPEITFWLNTGCFDAIRLSRAEDGTYSVGGPEADMDRAGIATVQEALANVSEFATAYVEMLKVWGEYSDAETTSSHVRSATSRQHLVD